MSADRIADLMRKVKALADRGAPGERENARRMLERLQRIHGITEAELEHAHVESDHFFRFHDDLERRLLAQVIYMVTGKVAGRAVAKWSGRRVKELGVTCTVAEKVEIETAFDFYLRALKEERALHRAGNGAEPAGGGNPSDGQGTRMVRCKAGIAGMYRPDAQRIVGSAGGIPGWKADALLPVQCR